MLGSYGIVLAFAILLVGLWQQECAADASSHVVVVVTPALMASSDFHCSGCSFTSDLWSTFEENPK